MHLTDGRVSYIEGNRDHPVNRGVLCAKGSAGIMQHTSPARLRAPMKRTGPRGSGEFEEITWDEALDLAASWLRPIRETAPEKLAFFTGRDQSQSFTGWWAQQYGTPNYAAHGGFSLDMDASPGNLTIAQTLDDAIDGSFYNVSFSAADPVGNNGIDVFFGGEKVGTVEPGGNDMERFSFELHGLWTRRQHCLY